jgi:hypothetical protein
MPEPGLFIVNPEGKAHIIDISDVPFARSDLHGMLNGLKFIRKRATRSEARRPDAARPEIRSPRAVSNVQVAPKSVPSSRFQSVAA